MRRLLVLDLETIPDEGLVRAVSQTPSRPYAEQVRQLVEERRERSGGRSTFLPIPFHRPVAACGIEARQDGDSLAVVDFFVWTDRRGESEASLLATLWERLSTHRLVTFRGRGFDLPVLLLRSLKLGVSMRAAPSSNGARAIPHTDLADSLSNHGNAPAAPLDLYSKLVGLPGKESVAGGDVQGLYEAGAFDRITSYCAADVLQTYLLGLRFWLVEGTLSREGYLESTRSFREKLPLLLAQRLTPGELDPLDGFLDRCQSFFDATGAREQNLPRSVA